MTAVGPRQASPARRGGKPGLFEIAHTGTIFLDEIGEMPAALQSRLLRVLQEREVMKLGSGRATPIDVAAKPMLNTWLVESLYRGPFSRRPSGSSRSAANFSGMKRSSTE